MEEAFDIPGGIYLSAEGIERLRAIHLAFVNSDAAALEAHLAASRTALLADDWKDFDAVYAAAYTINLCSATAMVAEAATTAPHSSLVKRGAVSVTFDVPFPTITEGSSFKETLIDETDIAGFIRLRGAIESLVPYRTAIAAVGLSPLRMVLDVFALPDTTGNGASGPIGLSAKTVRTSPGWQRLRRRFGETVVGIVFLPY